PCLSLRGVAGPGSRGGAVFPLATLPIRRACGRRAEFRRRRARLMLSPDFVILTAVAYVGLLFFLAYISDTRAKAGSAGILRSPIVYTLSISVYCTSWTFYGAV